MGTFPMELAVLAVLTLMAATMWLPYIIGVNTAPNGSLPSDAPDGFVRIANPALHRPWVQRAYRAHLNLLEQGIPFAVLLLLVDRVDGFTALTLWTALVFLGLRIAHAVGYITGWAALPLRPIIFTAGWVCCLVMGYAFFAAA